MLVTFRLMQLSGVNGPVETVDDTVVDLDTEAKVELFARTWSRGQIGHPWDMVTWTDEGGNGGDVPLNDAAEAYIES